MGIFELQTLSMKSMVDMIVIVKRAEAKQRLKKSE